MEQLKRWVDYMRILSACLPLCQRISRGRQAEAKICTIVCATQNLEPQGAVYPVLKTGIAIACANNFKVQQGFKFLAINAGIKHQIQNFQNIKVICKVRKRRHRNPLFGHIGDKISKNREKKYIRRQRGMKLSLAANLVLN